MREITCAVPRPKWGNGMGMKDGDGGDELGCQWERGEAIMGDDK